MNRVIHVVKWEIVHYEQFLLLPQFFQTSSAANASACAKACIRLFEMTPPLILTSAVWPLFYPSHWTLNTLIELFWLVIVCLNYNIIANIVHFKHPTRIISKFVKLQTFPIWLLYVAEVEVKIYIILWSKWSFSSYHSRFKIQYL